MFEAIILIVGTYILLPMSFGGGTSSPNERNIGKDVYRSEISK